MVSLLWDPASAHEQGELGSDSHREARQWNSDLFEILTRTRNNYLIWAIIELIKSSISDEYSHDLYQPISYPPIAQKNTLWTIIGR